MCAVYIQLLENRDVCFFLSYVLYVHMPVKAFQHSKSTLFRWMFIFIGLLMLNEPCSSCLNWMLFMVSTLPTPLLCPELSFFSLHFLLLFCLKGRTLMANEWTLFTCHSSYEAPRTYEQTMTHRNTELLTQSTAVRGNGLRERPAVSLLQPRCWIFCHLARCIFF